MLNLPLSIAVGLVSLLWQAPAPVDAGPQQAIRVEQLLEAVRGSYDHGLNPDDYHLAALEQLHQSARSGAELSGSELHVLLTDSMVRLVYHLGFGKVEHETGQRQLGDVALEALIEGLIATDDLANAVSSLAPDDSAYGQLKAQLKRHRAIAATAGWPETPSGPTIRPGSTDPRVEVLAARLASSGDLVAGSRAEAGSYGPVLQQAVRRFQARHGLEVDGLVGKATLRALNVPVEQRIDQIRVNLERMRWRLDGKADDRILVNIAGFRMTVIRDGKVLLSKKVIVGDTEDQTPRFRTELRHIVFNPTWTVPHSIASEELLLDIKNDLGFLARGKYELFDRDGNLVAASTVDWNAINVNNFPFTIVQQPGPANQLGQVKFMIPNEYSVCMHDTPSRHLFAAAARGFSHGCIRVHEPLALAELLLRDQGWTRPQIDAEIESGRTRTIALEEPLPVVVLYRSAEVSEQGVMHFYDDIYERDAAVLAALDAPL